MLIKYTGEKTSKKVHFGGKTFLFDPICVIEDEEFIKFLLGANMMGLFVEVAEDSKPEPIKIDDDRFEKEESKPIPSRSREKRYDAMKPKRRRKKKVKYGDNDI